MVTLLRPWSAPEAEAPALPAGPCANCGDEAPGWYCPSCGQSRRERVVSLREMLGDFLDDQLSLNSRLPRTVGLLLTRPGALTREYLQGRIARYIRPLRLYLGASVLFFLLLSLLKGSPEIDGGRQEGAPVAAPAASGGTSWVDDIQLETGIPSIDRRVAAKKERYRYVRPGEAFRSVMDDFLEYVPTMVFLLLPVYALLLKLLYLRRRRLYVEHFVFALHLHAFVFALFILMLLTGGILSELLTLWMMVYTFLAMRRVYGQSWLKTGVKYLVLGWSYSSLFFVALLATALAALLLA